MAEFEETEGVRALRPRAKPGLSVAAMLARRKVFVKVGLFREDLTIGEFIDWAALLLLSKHARDIDWSAMSDFASRLDCVLPLRRGLEYLAENFTSGASASRGRRSTAASRRRSRRRSGPCAPRPRAGPARFGSCRISGITTARSSAAIRTPPWPVLDRKRMKSLLGEQKAFCVLADMNGRYAYQVA